MQNNKGFTLIELLIVMAIMGILASMALPSYQDRVIRSQVNEAIGVAEVAMEYVQGHYKDAKRMPRNNAEAGLPDKDAFVGNFVKTVEVRDGAVHITLGNRVNKHREGKVLSFRPAVVEQAPVVPIAWVCGSASVPNKMTANADNRSTLMLRHMPVPCRY